MLFLTSKRKDSNPLPFLLLLKKHLVKNSSSGTSVTRRKITTHKKHKDFVFQQISVKKFLSVSSLKSNILGNKKGIFADCRCSEDF